MSAEQELGNKFTHKYLSKHSSSDHAKYQEKAGDIMLTCEDIDLVIKDGGSPDTVEEVLKWEQEHMLVSGKCVGCGTINTMPIPSDLILEWMSERGLIEDIEDDTDNQS